MNSDYTWTYTYIQIRLFFIKVAYGLVQKYRTPWSYQQGDLEQTTGHLWATHWGPTGYPWKTHGLPMGYPRMIQTAVPHYIELNHHCYQRIVSIGNMKVHWLYQDFICYISEYRKWHYCVCGTKISYKISSLKWKWAKKSCYAKKICVCFRYTSLTNLFLLASSHNSQYLLFFPPLMSVSGFHFH